MFTFLLLLFVYIFVKFCFFRQIAGFGIFVEKVEQGTKAAEIGLKRGDQVLRHFLFLEVVDIIPAKTPRRGGGQRPPLSRGVLAELK